MRKIILLGLTIIIVTALAACGNNGNAKEQEIKDVKVDPSAKTTYKDVMTELYFKENIEPLENIPIKVDGNKVEANQLLDISSKKLKEHQFFGEYFNLTYIYHSFEKQENGTYLLDVTLEFSDGNNVYNQRYLITFTGEPEHLEISSIEMTTDDGK